MNVRACARRVSIAAGLMLREAASPYPVNTYQDKLAELGLNRLQIAAAVGNIIGRMAQPGSELATHAWLQQRSALGGG